jgi:hypothetical protein
MYRHLAERASRIEWGGAAVRRRLTHDRMFVTGSGQCPARLEQIT